MKVTLKLFATLSDYLPPEAKRTNSVELDVDEGVTPQQLIDRFRLPPKLCHLVLVDGHFVPPAARSTRVLGPGETLAIWPPVAGG
ncbi:MAG: MoaD/ThiS family protein [Rhodocyclaceae bacterium]|nr:MoaD/ThiS family protein [Rhodocyclaceae bacterium]